MKKLCIQFTFLTLFMLSWHAKSLAQDPIFSQSFSSPLTINPSMTGLIDGSYRLAAIYRDQWRSVLGQPLTSYSANGDVRFSVNENARKNPDYYGVGLQFGSHRIGLFDFNTTFVGISGAYHKALGNKNRQYLSAGVNLSMNQQNLNYENLDFQDEFNGVNAFDFASQEILPPNNFGYGDFALGLHYSSMLGSYSQLFAGFAMHHLASPVIAFNKNPDSQGELLPGSNIYRRYVVHLSLSHVLTESYNIIPRLLYSKQGPHQVLQLGTNIRYQTAKSEGKAYQIGTWLKATEGFDKFELESAVLMFGIELNGLLLGLSYDINLNDLTNELKAQGIFEFSVSFVGDYDNEVNFCPEF